jgi:thioredoxin 1
MLQNTKPNQSIMKHIITVILFSLGVNMASCQSTVNNKQQLQNAAATINNTISTDEFATKIAANPGAQLIDVRTPAEFAEGHLKGAVNIDIYSSDFAERIGKLDKSKTVMVYCRSGGRSSSAAGKMEDMGFREIYNMDGGITKWTGGGKPVE